MRDGSLAVPKCVLIVATDSVMRSRLRRSLVVDGLYMFDCAPEDLGTFVSAFYVDVVVTIGDARSGTATVEALAGARVPPRTVSVSTPREAEVLVTGIVES